MRLSVHSLFCTFLGFLSACQPHGDDLPSMPSPPPIHPGLVSASGMIGPGGGHLGMPGGPTIDIPAGAIDSPLQISVTPTQDTAPAGAVTPLYHFEPDGIVFAHPVTITLPVSADAASNTRMFWSKHGSAGFEPVGGSVRNGVISAQVVHFSSGYAGAGMGTRTVSGSQVVTYVAPGGIINKPTDLSTVKPVVNTPDGQRIDGIGLADGSFSIPNVPDGTYTLNIGSSYYVTDSDVFDAGRVATGRPDTVLVTMPAPITFNVTGLDPWQDGDKLEAFSAEVDTWWFELDASFARGTTSLMGYSIDDSQAVTDFASYGHGFLVNGAKGDHLTLAQLSKHTSANGVSYLAMSKVFTPDPFTQIDGQGITLSGSFTDVSADHKITIDLRASQFEAAVGWDGTHAVLLNPMAAPLDPSMGFPGTTFGVLGEPGGTGYGEYSATADYLMLNVPHGGGDTLATDMTYGTPGTGTWGAIGDARQGYVVQHQLPGTGAPAWFFIGLGRSDSLSAFTGTPVTPALGPVRNPTINGRDLFQAQSAVGTSPSIAWQIPKIGTPTHYAVTIYRLFEGSGDTQQEKTATIHTTATSVTLPANMLAMGEHYAIQIAADMNPGVTAPSRTLPAGASAQILSAIIAP